MANDGNHSGGGRGGHLVRAAVHVEVAGADAHDVGDGGVHEGGEPRAPGEERHLHLGGGRGGSGLCLDLKAT